MRRALLASVSCIALGAVPSAAATAPKGVVLRIAPGGTGTAASVTVNDGNGGSPALGVLNASNHTFTPVGDASLFTSLQSGASTSLPINNETDRGLFVTPQMFGAVCNSNGTTGNGADDTTAVQNAINFSEATGRTLKITAKSTMCRITAPLVITYGKRLTLDGDYCEPYTNSRALTNTPGPGSWLYFDHAGVGISIPADGLGSGATGTATGDTSSIATTGTILQNFCTYRNQPAYLSANVSVTGSISGTTLTATAVSGGSILVGASLTGSGVATGTTIVSQASGTAGSTGTYAVSVSQTIASEAFATGWAPNANDYDISALQDDTIIRHVVTLNPTKAVKVDGRFTIDDLRGDPYQVGIDAELSEDLSRILNVHFWNFDTINPLAIAYQRANLQALILGRIDNPFITNFFSINAKICVHLISTPNGVPSKIHGVNIDCDEVGNTGLLSEATGATGQLVNFTTQGDDKIGAAVGNTDSYNGVDINAANNVLSFSGLRVTKYGGVPIIAAANAGTVLTIDGLYVDIWGINGTSGTAAVEADNGTMINIGAGPVFLPGPVTTTQFATGGTGVINQSAATSYGSWTPTVVFGSTSVATGGAAARWVKVGNTVTVTFDITTAATGSGAALISGLPFANGGATAAATIGYHSGTSGITSWECFINGGSSSISLGLTGATGLTNATNTNMPSGARIAGSATYTTN